MSNYCGKEGKVCNFANQFGNCNLTTCTQSAAWNNTHSSNNIYNLTTSPKLDDGIYMQVFAVKDGVRYDMNVINLRDASKTLTESLMDGIEKLVKYE